MRPNALSELSLIRKLKLQQLLVFERVLETGSVRRAANELALTQPAVTKAIQELEATIDGELFSRSPRGVVPTDLARLLGRRVKSLMAELRYMKDELNDLRFGTSGHVIVGTLISASARLLPDAIALLKSRSPNVLVTVREGPTASLFPALATGDVDIVVGRLPERELPIARAFPLTHEVLFDETMCVVAGRHCDAALRRAKHLDELVDRPWILPPPDSPSHLATEQLFAAAHLPLPSDVVESLSILTNLGLVIGSSRIVLMPGAAARQFEKAGLVHVLALNESVPFGKVGFSIRAQKQPSLACEAFIRCLREAAKASLDSADGGRPGNPGDSYPES